MTFRVADGATAEINYYSGYENTATVEVDDGAVTITFTAQTYIYGISIIENSGM